MKSRKDYSDKIWRVKYKNHFYKSLDVKSNSLKILERKYLMNKSLMKDIQKKYDKIKSMRIIPVIFQKKRKFSPKGLINTLQNPILQFKLPQKNIIKDVVKFTLTYVK